MIMIQGLVLKQKVDTECWNSDNNTEYKVGLKFNKRASRRWKSRVKNKARVRKKVSGTVDRPRLAVFRSGRHIYAQLVVDTDSKTLTTASTVEKKVPVKNKSSMDAARWVGQEIAKRALEKNIKEIVFDRSGYVFHGRVKAVADGARESGLNF